MVDDPGKVLRNKLQADRDGYQKRVADEQDDLKRKVDMLHSFIQSGGYYNVHDEEKGLLQSQLGVMQQYLAILNARIKLHREL